MKIDSARIAVPVVLVIYLLALLYAWLIYAPSDDTYIYLVYAKNFLAGNGVTYNGMKVQGFTSVLWMTCIILAGKLGAELPKAASMLSAASGLLALLLTYYLTTLLGLSRRRAWASVAILASAGDFAFYMSNGLESVLFTAMLVWSTSYIFREDSAKTLRSWGLPAVLTLTILARPEGMMVAAIVLAVLAWESKQWPLLARNLAVIAALIVPVLVWQQVYYGSFIPNTYYAKSGAGLINAPQGLRYLRNFIAANALLVLLFLYPFVTRMRRMDRTERWTYLVVGLWVLHVTVQGGDNMVGFRAHLPIVPLLGVLAVYQFRDLEFRRFLFGVAAVCLSQLFIYNSGHAIGSSWNYDVKWHAEQWAKVFPQRIDIAHHLRDTLPPNSLIALNAAGTVPYYSGLPTIDMLGLNNADIARHGRRDRALPYGHQCGDADYVLRQQPAAILLTGMGGSKGDFFLGDRELMGSQDFRAFYRIDRLPHSRFVYLRRAQRTRPPIKHRDYDPRAIENNKR